MNNCRLTSFTFIALLLLINTFTGQSFIQEDPFATPGFTQKKSMEIAKKSNIKTGTTQKNGKNLVNGQVVTIIESQSSNIGHDMDLEWLDIANSMGFAATIHAQIALEDSTLLDTTDILIISSGVIDIPVQRRVMILNYLKSGKPIYLQNEYICTYSSNMLFEELTDSLGGAVTLLGTISGDLIPMNVSGILSNTPNNVDTLTYFWYGCHATGDSITVIPFLEHQGNNYGFIFTPPNPSHGIIITTSDQDWVRNPLDYIPPTLLMENILQYLSTGGTVGITSHTNNFINGFSLQQNYPNPFNPNTVISYQLSTASNVELTIFNIAGQKIRRLVNDEQPGGLYEIEWNGREDAGQQVASGVYIYQLKTNQGIKSKKMLLLK